MNLTAQDLEKIKHYARKVYYNEIYKFRDMSFEDVYHEFICVALAKGSVNGLASSVIYRRLLPYDAVSIATAKPFSALISRNKHNGEEFDGLDGVQALQTFDNYFDNLDGDCCILKIADLLYSDNPERRERFLNYVYGMPVQGDHARTIREKLYRRGGELLAVLRDCGKIGENDYNRYIVLLATMNNYAPQKRPLLNSSSHIAVRKYYERHKEERKAYEHERYKKRKAEKFATT